MSKPKRAALGRGLGALLPDKAGAPPRSQPPSGVPRELAIEAIEANRAQPRKRFDEERLRELSQSIATQGIIQPIVVTPLPGRGQDQPRYQILAMQQGITPPPNLGDSVWHREWSAWDGYGRLMDEGVHDLFWLRALRLRSMSEEAGDG